MIYGRNRPLENQWVAAYQSVCIITHTVCWLSACHESVCVRVTGVWETAQWVRHTHLSHTHTHTVQSPSSQHGCYLCVCVSHLSIWPRVWLLIYWSHGHFPFSSFASTWLHSRSCRGSIYLLISQSFILFFFSWGLNPIIVCGVIARSRQKVPEIVPWELMSIST